MDGMHIRPYVPDQDDEAMLRIGNAAYADEPDFVPGTMEEVRVSRKSPNWTPEGKFIAELDGRGVGMGQGYVDKHQTEPFAYANVAVVPEYRRRGIGTALGGTVLDFLRAKKMERARAGSWDRNMPGRAFLEKLGFKPIRKFSLMRRPLAGLPSGLGENTDVAIEELGTTDDDVALLTRLSNEAFREHFAHRDGTVEERTFWMRNMDKLGYTSRRTLARLDGEPVGFLVHGIDTNENAKLGTKRGGLWSLGVLKPHRCIGIGTRLMLDGMEWLVEQGMETVGLGVDDENVTRARSLYERLGFKLVRGSTTWERELD